MFRQRRAEVLSSDNCVACDGGRKTEASVHAAFILYCKLYSPEIRGLRGERLASSLLLDGLDGIRKQWLRSAEAISSKQLELQG